MTEDRLYRRARKLCVYPGCEKVRKVGDYCGRHAAYLRRGFRNIDRQLVKPCQRPGCLNLGRRRLQQRTHTIRSLYLCDWCLESLLPIHLNDLFVKFGETPELRSRD